MVNPFIQTQAEKEEYVLDMLQRGYGWNEIAKECHVSPNTISAIRKKYFGVDASKSTNQTSKETQALKLFGEGKSLFQVATELDISADSVFVIYQNFLRLRNMDGFVTMYEQVKGNIQPFLHMFDLMNSLGMTPEQVAQLAGYGIRLPSICNIHSKLCNDVQIMESQKRYLGFQLYNAQNHLDRYKSSLGFYYNECEMKRNELSFLNSEINNKRILIQNLDNDEGYIRVKEAAKKQTKLIMQDFRLTTVFTLSATVEAIRRYPDNQTLIFDITSFQNNSTPYHQHWKSHEPQLLQLVENVQSELVERITGAAVSNLDAVPDKSQT